MQSLTAESTLGELPAFEVTVRPEILTSVIDRELGGRPDLPGVVIADGDQLLGMISRPMLFAQLSRPFGQELYLKRPIQLLLEAERREPLLLPSHLPVADAAHLALQRPDDRVYEPVIVRDERQFRLLDAHTLLIAQSRLLTLANDKIRSQADVAEAANQAKSMFLANMSHEIRTPLTAIFGFAENLLDPTCGLDERVAATETILRNGHHLLQLINDILDLSKIEANHLEIERLQFSPGEVVSDVISALRFRAESKKISISLAYDGPIPDLIESDPTRMRQILMNLIGNAIKFTERGQVLVRLRMIDAGGNRYSAPRADQGLRVECKVVDSEIGMSESQLSRLFSPFMQADQSMARRFGGTGLGLSISRRLTRLLGGDIVVTSQPGVGSTFTLQIDTGSLVDVVWQDRPSSTVKTALPLAPMTSMQLSGRILLAEDGPDNQLLIGSFLRKQGAVVTIVDNGQKAVEVALASLDDAQSFDAILMDMQMPVLDGYSATSELRRRGWTRPILALTANVMHGDRQKCLDAGCDDFATKPINRAALLQQLHTLMTRQSEILASPGSQEPAVSALAAFDFNSALERVGGDRGLFQQIAEMLIKIGPEWLESLHEHLEAGDESAVRRVAHSLKTSADNIGGKVACETLSRLECAPAENCSDVARSMWPECRDEFLRLLKTVEAYLRIGHEDWEIQKVGSNIDDADPHC